MAEIPEKVIANSMAEIIIIPKKRWSLWLKSFKNVVAMAEIPKKGGRYG